MRTFLFLICLATAASAATFEIKDGDRVLLLGDALLERETHYGHLEARMHEQFPTAKFTVRNLSWSGETPRGWSRASFDRPDKGHERLKEQIAAVKPTVAILGFGMAASLQELTDRSGDIALNRDPARYGAEPMSAARFKKELGEIMDAIGKDTRFILLAPIPHQDLRKTRPGLPDPAPHNALLLQYAQAIGELAAERSAVSVALSAEELGIGQKVPVTENGIHLSPDGHRKWADLAAVKLGWNTTGWAKGDRAEQVRAALLKKNELFFHQTRPANSTYIFGFRKHEQGKNAAEIPQFDPLIEAVDAEIARIKAGGAPAAPEKPEAPAEQTPAKPLPAPAFTTTEDMEMTLWADTPLVGKPVGMNWDAAGRLWVACSPVYPMIKPGGHPEDKIVVLEDTDHDGKADKTTTFASGLVIAAGVAPDFGKDGKSISAAYVGASTELLRLEDTDGDGKADTRRTVLGGFGTEDTHHTIHTLRWGPDGRLYFDQSIYIHSHIETPWGMVRANSGAIMAYDPRTERTEVHAKGWCNPWGHAWDEWGQEFVTDGAGGQGISWLVPGAMYFTYENAPRIMPSISPGGYPKYCGLELVRSPIFPPDWQGNAITCDFRAHRIVRFQINDLSPGKSGYVTKELPAPVVTTDATFRPIDVKHGPDGALYFADWTNPIINHGEVDFRDPRRDHVNGRIWRLAPKGKAGKWESFVGKKNSELAERLTSKSAWEREKTMEVMHKRYADPSADPESLVVTPEGTKGEDSADNTVNWWLQSIAVDSFPGGVPTDAALAARWLRGHKMADTATVFPLLHSKDARFRAVLCRFMDEASTVVDFTLQPPGTPQGIDSAAVLKPSLKGIVDAKSALARDPHPRVRLEAMRALSRIPSAESAALVLEAAVNVPGAKDAVAALPDAPKQQFASSSASESADTHYAYAAWLSVSDLAPQVAEWLETAATAQEAPKHRDAMISYALQTLPSAQAGPLLTKIIAKNGVPKDGSGPWIELIGQSGGPAECRILLDALLADTIPDGDKVPALADPALKFTVKDANRRAAAALVAAARRGAKPTGVPLGKWPFYFYAPDEAIADVVRLAGLWKDDALNAISSHIGKDTDPALLDACFEAMRALGTNEAAAAMAAIIGVNLGKPEDQQYVQVMIEKSDRALRFRALGSLAAIRPDVALAAVRNTAGEGDEAALLPLFREMFRSEPFAKQFASAVPQTMTKPALAAALKAARELGKKGDKLASALTPLAGEMPAAAPQDFGALVEMTKKNGNPVEGETLYRRAALACTVCHAIGGAGGKVGPDMTTLGASAPLDYIVESVMAPAVKVKEGYHAVSLALKGGRSATGVVARESDKDILLRDATGAESTVAKADIEKREDIGSLMPAGLLAQLSQREQTHVIAFLSALGKPGPFDATKATVARTWEIFPGKDVEAVVAGKSAKPGAKVLTMVDGRLLKAQITEALPMIPDAGDTIIAVARFNGSGKTRLNLTGVTKAWLDGAPLAIASEPRPEVELSNGNHTLAVKLDTKDLPELLRAGCDDVRFLNE